MTEQLEEIESYLRSLDRLQALRTCDLHRLMMLRRELHALDRTAESQGLHGLRARLKIVSRTLRCFLDGC